MIKKIIKIMFLIIWSAICIFGAIRSNYPKNYSPLDKYALIIYIPLIVIVIIMRIGNVSFNAKNNNFDFWITTLILIFTLLIIIGAVSQYILN